jgi:predicted nucleotidyltransferase
VKLLEIVAGVREALPAPRTFAIIGAVARNAWAPPRATTDLDLSVVADSSALAAVEAALSELGYRCIRRQQADPDDELPDLLIFRGDPDLRQVDVLVAKTDFEQSALARSVSVELAGEEMVVASAEDLIVYKLLADRPRDRDDVRAIVRTATRAARDLDWAYVEHWTAYWGIEDRLERLRSGEPG